MQHDTEVSPERVGIAGVLWSTLRWCICVQLGKVHGHSSLFRLQESGCKGQDSLAKADMVEGDNKHKQPSIHSQKEYYLHCLACPLQTKLVPLMSSSSATAQAYFRNRLRNVSTDQIQQSTGKFPASSPNQFEHYSLCSLQIKTQPPVTATLYNHVSKPSTDRP